MRRDDVVEQILDARPVTVLGRSDVGLAVWMDERILPLPGHKVSSVQATGEILRRNQPLRINGRCIVVGDGIKVPKRGRKMPGVKLLHQQSESNTKPEYIQKPERMITGTKTNRTVGA